MSTRRFVLFAVLITLGFGLLPLDGPARTTGKIALALAACLFAWRPESRRRMQAASAGVRTKPKRWIYGLVAGTTGAMIALIVLDRARIGEILALADKLLLYVEVSAYLWLVSLAIAGRSWRIELARARAQSSRVAPGDAASSTAPTRRS